MARKTANYTVTDEGRDKGKLFLISEMPASQGEQWAIKAILGLMAGNVDVPENALDLGMSGLAELGLKKLAQLPPHVLMPLMEELMACIQIIPDPRKTHVVRALIESDIEEIATRVKLKWEVLKLHVDFSQAAAPLISRVKEMTAAQNKPVTKTSRR